MIPAAMRLFYMTARTADDNSRAAISATDAASKSAVDGDRLDDGKPHMAALVIDGTAKKIHLYVDGNEIGTAADLGDNTLDKVKQEHALGRPIRLRQRRGAHRNNQ